MISEWHTSKWTVRNSRGMSTDVKADLKANDDKVVVNNKKMMAMKIKDCKQVRSFIGNIL